MHVETSLNPRLPDFSRLRTVSNMVCLITRLSKLELRLVLAVLHGNTVIIEFRKHFHFAFSFVNVGLITHMST